jgi:uncharacterized protein (DUF1800 family)
LPPSQVGQTLGARVDVVDMPATAPGLTSTDPVRHLLRRATYGPTPESEAELRALGASAWLERQLRPTSIDDAACDAVVARFPQIALDIAGVRAGMASGEIKNGTWEVMQQVGQVAMARAIWSRRQLFEVMVDFWSNHLNVTCPSSGLQDNRQVYDRVIRANALGRFADMLKASAVSPAMLTYLDNRSSAKAKPNENYGRELLELHTVGMVYTEADVAQAARLLTGLTVDKFGLYQYDAKRHATGPVTVLGFTHANATAEGGEAASFALLDYLATHPATAARIARKLCVRFVADEPPPALVARLAQVYLAQRTAIVPVLRALFTSPEFAASVGNKVRTPLEDIVATVRTLGLGPELVDPVTNPTGTTAIRALYTILDSAGHAPLRWGLPDGYPDVASGWASPTGYLVRWNTHVKLTTGAYPTKQLTRPASLLQYLAPAQPATHGALIDALARRLVGTVLRAEHSAALLTFLGKTAATPLKSTDPAVTTRFPYLVALILNSPYFQVR